MSSISKNCYFVCCVRFFVVSGRRANPDPITSLWPEVEVLALVMMDSHHESSCSSPFSAPKIFGKARHRELESDLPKVAQLVGGGAGISTRSPSLYSDYCLWAGSWPEPENQRGLRREGARGQVYASHPETHVRQCGGGLGLKDQAFVGSGAQVSCAARLLHPLDPGGAGSGAGRPDLSNWSGVALCR